MTDVARPSSGEAGACAAVALGWQMAKLYHSPVPRGLAEDPRRADRLPGFSGFSGATHTKWLSEQITMTADCLVAALAWIGGTLLAALKASGALLGSAVKGAEGWLWQTELDESVVQAATRLPPPARHHRITGSAVGAMTLSESKPPPAPQAEAPTTT